MDTGPQRAAPARGRVPGADGPGMPGWCMTRKGNIRQGLYQGGIFRGLFPQEDIYLGARVEFLEPTGRACRGGA